MFVVCVCVCKGYPFTVEVDAFSVAIDLCVCVCVCMPTIVSCFSVDMCGLVTVSIVCFSCVYVCLCVFIFLSYKHEGDTLFVFVCVGICARKQRPWWCPLRRTLGARECVCVCMCLCV